MSKSNDVVVPRTHAQLTAIAQNHVDISVTIDNMPDDADEIRAYLESLDLSLVSHPTTDVECEYNHFVANLDQYRLLLTYFDVELSGIVIL